MSNSKEKFLRTCPQIIIPDELAPLKSFIDCLSDKVDVCGYTVHYSDYRYSYIKPNHTYTIYDKLMKWKEQPDGISKVHVFVAYKSNDGECSRYEYDVVGVEVIDGKLAIDTQVEPRYRYFGDLHLVSYEIDDMLDCERSAGSIRTTFVKKHRYPVPKGPLAMVNRHRRKRW